MGTAFTKGGGEEFGTAIEGIDSHGAGKVRIPGRRPKPLVGRGGKEPIDVRPQPPEGAGSSRTPALFRKRQ
jgi:hypothetical protein